MGLEIALSTGSLAGQAAAALVHPQTRLSGMKEPNSPAFERTGDQLLLRSAEDALVLAKR